MHPPSRLVPPALAAALLASPLLAGCAVHDAYVADQAQTKLLGMSEVDLESCLGVPDQHASFGSTDVLTYYTTSSSSISYSIPIVGGLGFSNGGNCHATFRVENGVVTRLLYSGEKNATGGPNAYCTPIVRTCMAWLDAHPGTATAHQPTTAVSTRTDAPAPNGTVPPGSPSGAPQPGASTAGFAPSMPTPTPR